MATSSFGSTAASSASLSKNAPNSSAYSPLCHPNYHRSKLSFRVSPKPKLTFLSKSTCNRPVIVRAQLNEVRLSQKFSFEQLVSSFRSVLEMVLEPFVAVKVPVDGSSNAAVELEVSPSEVENVKPSNEPSSTDFPSKESTSQFVTQVRSLIKLVDSRDIVELELKQLDCELVIRKKEALVPPPSSQPMVMAQPYSVPYVASVGPAPAPSPVQAPVPAAPLAPAPAASAAAESSKSSHPPLRSPMAGTFYRSPAPGERPFVKVGDKVQKGQVICIIEAMKLMNEIEADQSGTIVEIIAEDGKPVSVETPLFVIEP